MRPQCVAPLAVQVTASSGVNTPTAGALTIRSVATIVQQKKGTEWQILPIVGRRARGAMAFLSSHEDRSPLEAGTCWAQEVEPASGRESTVEI